MLGNAIGNLGFLFAVTNLRKTFYSFPIRWISRGPMHCNKRAFWICCVFFFVSTPPAPTCRLSESLAASLTNVATDLRSESNFTQNRSETVGRQCGLPLVPLLSFGQTRSKNQQDAVTPVFMMRMPWYPQGAIVPACHHPEFHSRRAIHTWKRHSL